MFLVFIKHFYWFQYHPDSVGAYYGRGIVYQRMGIQVILKISLKFSHLIISTCKRIPINFASKCMIMLTVKCKTETVKIFLFWKQGNCKCSQECSWIHRGHNERWKPPWDLWKESRGLSFELFRYSLSEK